MKIHDLFASEPRTLSLEFYPPKDARGHGRLDRVVERLRRREPSFVTMTYGAGGSTRELTVDLVQRLRTRFDLEAASHLTCLGSTQADMAELLDRLRDAGVENLLCLRGDAPLDAPDYRPPPETMRHADELVALAARYGCFSVGVAGYPEKHPEAPSLAVDLEHLGRKLAAGADFVITQLFFDNRDYFSFVEQARAAGITARIIPGILPITNYTQAVRFTALCGARIPDELSARFEAAGDDRAAVSAVGIEHAIQQCRDLLEGGAPGIHLYTLNRGSAIEAVIEGMGDWR